MFRYIIFFYFFEMNRIGIDALIAMPLSTPAIKVNAVQGLGASVELIGDNYDDAQAWALQKAKEDGRYFIPPFDDPDVISGQVNALYNNCSLIKAQVRIRFFQ